MSIVKNAADEASLLKVAAGTIRAVLQERDEATARAEAAEQKLASIERRDLYIKIATELREKGIDSQLDDEQLFNKIAEYDSAGKLETLSTAVDIAPMDGKLGSVSENKTSGGENPLVSWIRE